MAASPPNKFGPSSRRSTGDSVLKLRSRRTTDHITDAQASPSSQDTVQDFVTAYKLPFSRLKTWLEVKFPKARYPTLAFEKKLSVQKDKYVLELPRLLTESERSDILDNLRDRDAPDRQQSDEEQEAK